MKKITKDWSAAQGVNEPLHLATLATPRYSRGKIGKYP